MVALLLYYNYILLDTASKWHDKTMISLCVSDSVFIVLLKVVSDHL